MRASGVPRKEVYRGTGFDDAHRGFFTAGKKYRVPMFLATSVKRAVARRFMGGGTGIHMMWRILMQRHNDMWNAALVKRSLFQEEEEYLFAPHSVFTVDRVTWNSGAAGDPHEIVLISSHDNMVESEMLPLAPWS